MFIIHLFYLDCMRFVSNELYTHMSNKDKLTQPLERECLDSAVEYIWMQKKLIFYELSNVLLSIKISKIHQHL